MGQLRHFWPLRTTFSTAGPPKYQPIGPVSEICVPDNAKCHHQKFRRDRSTRLGLVRCATDRQTDRLLLRRGCTTWRARPPRAHPRPGGCRPSNGGETPPNPPRTSIFATSVPSLRSGTDNTIVWHSFIEYIYLYGFLNTIFNINFSLHNHQTDYLAHASENLSDKCI